MLFTGEADAGFSLNMAVSFNEKPKPTKRAKYNEEFDPELMGNIYESTLKMCQVTPGD